jgi:hypothetical protein
MEKKCAVVEKGSILGDKGGREEGRMFRSKHSPVIAREA